jgi:hypothetical protein
MFSNSNDKVMMEAVKKRKHYDEEAQMFADEEDDWKRRRRPAEAHRCDDNDSLPLQESLPLEEEAPQHYYMDDNQEENEPSRDQEDASSIRTEQSTSEYNLVNRSSSMDVEDEDDDEDSINDEVNSEGHTGQFNATALQLQERPLSHENQIPPEQRTPWTAGLKVLSGWRQQQQQEQYVPQRKKKSLDTER